ncbi:GDP-mannose 4,6-dehydratase [Laspinema palackyanum]|uniref:GDP-mannose 4,6-dehydratase n=1 Tax=Laspinema palackyanum TaxID=3231601 RepID=UPI00349F6AA3
MTATWNGATAQANKTVHRIAAEGAVYHATSDHVVFVQQGESAVEKPAGEVKVGDSLALIDLPQSPEQLDLTETEAWLLGVLVAAAEIDNSSQVTLTIPDTSVGDRLAASWRKVSGGNCDRLAASRLQLSGNPAYSDYLRSELYSKSQDKRIPKRILNAGDRERLAFLDGFKAVSPLAGDSFTVQTPSALLAAGLYWMSITTLQQPAWIATESQGDGFQYQIHVNATPPQGTTRAQVVTAEPINYQGWLFDLATTSGTFHAGVGQGWIHNSPRRGETFVTRKITRAVARIVAGKQKKLFLGNLDSKRDWGYAKDYVRAMWLMLQQDQPDDYVVATNETHTIRKFLDLAFNFVNLNWEDYVEFDPRYLRPAEVDLLIGDPSKAKEKLGWEPSITFEQLVALMVDSDLKAIGVESPTGQPIIDRAFIRQDSGHMVD